MHSIYVRSEDNLQGSPPSSVWVPGIETQVVSLGSNTFTC